MTEPTELRSETLVAVDAVKRAIAIARGGVGSQRVTAKEGRDLVTGADVAVENAVRALLTEALGFSVVGEERGGEVSAGDLPPAPRAAPS